MPSGDPPSSVQEAPRILLIDSYDSFTYNLASLCKRAIPHCTVHIIKNDQISFANLEAQLKCFHAVIIGPGPGSPDNEKDIAVVRDVWKLADENTLPIFGVCLGLQSLGIEFGATLRRLNVVKHGQISRIEHDGRDIFKDVGDVRAVRYHSLHVTLNGSEPLIPLAWADDGSENGRVLMAVKHVKKPFWGVQYHPESVRTQGGGSEVLRNFWRLAKKWSAVSRRRVQPWSTEAAALFGPAWPHLHLVSIPKTASSTKHSLVQTRILSMPDLAVTDICEMLGVNDESSDFVMLDSAAQPGRFSIVGVFTASTPKITYRIGDQRVRIERGGAVTWEAVGEDVWTWLAVYMRSRRAQGGNDAVPFWGGFVGFLSYELGVNSLTKDLCSRAPEQKGKHPDVSLVFVERSIVLDSVTGSIYLQSILADDEQWLAEVASQLQAVPSVTTSRSTSGPKPKRRRTASAAQPTIMLPNKDQYISRIKQAQEFLQSGDSYELCLTAPTRISLPNNSFPGNSSSWHLYKTLRQRNPAPHSAYLRMYPSTLISSSPERFLSYSRPPNSICQLRPIKGTVRKAPGVTRTVAEHALIGSVKEVAENLMIVDLIRHDLHGVVGEDVETKQFCGVEEYETVWQLVSVIEGKLPPGTELDAGHEVGWEVLRQSLPPGSMTGAPKKRSVEILHSLEGQDRNVYSGVFGYWCAGGGGDWSVTIRSCFKHDGVTEDGPERHRAEPLNTEWTLGAGGAITALSDPEAEWDEMIVKVESVLRAFQAAAE